MEEMLNLDMRVLMKEAERVSALHNNKFKLLPLMANASKFQLGALVSQSFAEKMNSARKNIVSDHQTQLDSDTTSKHTYLRMNKGFMEFARQFNARKRGRN